MLKMVNYLHILVAASVLCSCGATSSQFVNWQNHVTVRTCVDDPNAPAKDAMDLCTGYRRAQDVVGAVTDVHYAVIQIERVFFRDLPEWTRDAEVCVDVSIRGLLPGGKEYRQVLDIVHVNKEAYLQLQNLSVNFPVRYANRVVSIQFSIRELDDVAAAKKWFDAGKKLLASVKSSPISGGFLGAVLLSEITQDVAAIVIGELAKDDHVFSLKQVDFLPVANTTGTQEQLMFTEGRYVVVAVPPADIYDYMHKIFGAYPEQLDREWLLSNASYKGGYLMLKELAANYLYTPYVAFNFAVLKRYADRSPVVESLKSASRAIEMKQVVQAEGFLARASASFCADAGFSFKRELKKQAPKMAEKRGLLEMEPGKLLEAAEKMMALLKKSKLEALEEILKVKIPGTEGTKSVAASAPRSAVLEQPEEGVYTQLEYSYFIDLLNALTMDVALAKSAQRTAQDAIPVLEAYIQVKTNNTDLPLFNSECEIINRNIKRLWRTVKSSYNIPAHVKVQAGKELSDALPGDAQAKKNLYNTLLRLQSEVDYVKENCLGSKSKAY